MEAISLRLLAVMQKRDESANRQGESLVVAGFPAFAFPVAQKARCCTEQSLKSPRQV